MLSVAHCTQLQYLPPLSDQSRQRCTYPTQCNQGLVSMGIGETSTRMLNQEHRNNVRRLSVSPSLALFLHPSNTLCRPYGNHVGRAGVGTRRAGRDRRRLHPPPRTYFPLSPCATHAHPALNRIRARCSKLNVSWQRPCPSRLAARCSRNSTPTSAAY